MARTLAQIRTEVIKLLTSNRYITGTPDSVAAGRIDDLSEVSLYADSFFNQHFVLDGAGATFMITSSTQSNGRLSLNPSGSTPNSGAYEVSVAHPRVLLDAINNVARMEYPLLNQWYVTDAYVTGSPIPDPGFEDWASASTLNHWTVNTATLARTQESDINLNTLHGAYSAALSGAAGYLSLAGRFRQDIFDLRGYTITLYGWVKTLTASNARINLLYRHDANLISNYSAYHSGNGGWELLEVTVTVPEDAEYIDLRCHIETTSTAWFDNVWLEGGPPIWRHRLPTPLVEGVTTVMVAPVYDRENVRDLAWMGWPYVTRRLREDAPGNSRYEIEFQRLPPAGYRIRLEGPARLATLVAASDSWQITDTESAYLEHLAALEVLNNRAAGIAAQNHDSVRSIQEQLMRRIPSLRQDINAPVRAGSLNWDL